MPEVTREEANGKFRKENKKQQTGIENPRRRLPQFNQTEAIRLRGGKVP